MTRRVIEGLCGLALAGTLAHGQTGAAKPAFEVASIKPAAPMPMGRMMVRMGGDPGRVDYSNVSLKDVLARAYNVKRYQITGPAWLDSERFDIVAKVPEGVPKDQIPEMLKALLVERFKMEVRTGKRDQSVYALVEGKSGAKLTKAAVDPAVAKREASEPPPAPGAPARTANRQGSRMMIRDGKIEATNVTMGGLADMLSNFMDRPVVDQTGIQGQYDLKLEAAMNEMPGVHRMGPPPGAGSGNGPGPAAGEGGPAPESAPTGSIFTSLAQLGLKLEPRKAPMDYIVIEKAEKVPTEN